MKSRFRVAALAAALGLSGAANAAIDTTDAGAKGGGDIIVLIQNDAGDSLLVDTNINAEALFGDTAFSYTSDGALTALIGGFLGGGGGSFYAVGAWKEPGVFPDQTFFSTAGNSLSGSQIGQAVTNFNAYAELANPVLAADDAGDGPDVENVTGRLQQQFNNPNLGAFGSPAGSLDAEVAFLASRNAPFAGGLTETVQGFWSLSSAGLLEYNAVPLPAGAWLMGSALLGVAGLRRRRNDD